MGLPGAHRPLLARLLRGTGRLISGRVLVAAWPTAQQTMTTDTPSIPVGVDGEPVELDTLLEFAVRPRALRLLQPSRNERTGDTTIGWRRWQTDANFAQATVIDADFTDATVANAYFDDYDELAKDATLNGVDFEHARFGSTK